MTKRAAALSRLERIKSRFYNGVFAGHSGGKDSCVILHLAKQVFPEIVVVHNVKPMLGTSGNSVDALTEQHPQTLQFLYSKVCVENRVLFMHSSQMESWVRECGMNCQIDGARRSEANRPGKSSNFIMDGRNVNRKELPEFVDQGIFNMAISYPIYDWTDDDVFDYLFKFDIPFSEEYNLNGEVREYWKRKGK